MNAPITTERAAKERGIPFSGPLVRAILDGTKTQTRRIVKPQPLPEMREEDGRFAAPSVYTWERRIGRNVSIESTVRCPYGAPGDRLYVREAWRVPKSLDALSGAKIAAKALDAGYVSPWAAIQYEADGARNQCWIGSAQPGRYRQARFMPRWASRITLEVTGVRVERLQSITEADARAEGCPGFDGAGHPAGDDGMTPREDFASLWDEINSEHASWGANPWAWVVSFRRVTP